MSREGPRGWWASALGRTLTLTPTPAGKGPLQARVCRHDKEVLCSGSSLESAVASHMFLYSHTYAFLRATVSQLLHLLFLLRQLKSRGVFQTEFAIGETPSTAML